MTDQPTTPTAPRERSAVDALAEEHLDAYAALDPAAATAMGLSGHDHRLTDYSPSGIDERSALARRTLAELDRTAQADGVDEVTAAVLRHELGLQLELAEAGELERLLNVLHSPVQEIRMAFDLMATATVDDWRVVAERLRAVPGAVTSYAEALRAAAAAGRVAARRQAERCAEQCDDNVGEAGFFARLAREAVPGEGGELPPAVRDELTAAAEAAAGAYAGLAATLRTELVPLAPSRDAFGADRYSLWSRYFLGATVDLAETYAWGVEEVERLRAEGDGLARALTGDAGAVLDAGVEHLERDPARQVEGAEAFRDWMQATSDEAVSALAGTHFDIPDAIRALDCRIAPTSTGVIYYTPPSEDLSRPGAMWWSVPKGTTDFGTWQQRTTVYHEGVPGHHLQLAQTVLRRQELNRYRRVAAWNSGHGEGWALYAERLMAELGFLDDPGDRMGLVASQLLRSARVVVDIGVHCGFTAPEVVGGGAWEPATAWAYLSSMVPEPEPVLRFELDRYLGMPGQAPSYKIGERVWLDLRDQARAAAGSEFDVVAWHRRALDLGSVGLDVLRSALAT